MPMPYYSDMIVRELSSGEQSPVRLGMITSSVHYAISLINDFFSDSDDMSFRFEITEKNSFELLDLLKHNLIDLAIIRTPFDTNRAFDYIKLTNDHLLESGVISDPLVYLENVPDYQVRGKHDLLHALRVQRQQQKEANSNAENHSESQS